MLLSRSVGRSNFVRVLRKKLTTLIQKRHILMRTAELYICIYIYNKRYKNETELSKYIWKLREKEDEHTITWKKLRQPNTCQRQSGLCNLCLEEKVELLVSQAKPSTQLNRRFEVPTCRHVSPSTSIAPTSKLMKTEPNRPLRLSEDHRRHRRMLNTVSQRAEASVTLTMYIYIYYVLCIYIYIVHSNE